ncbi:uncharacterized protein LOC118647933 isoform X3 [Monomorium pharaonis]|uniref:uncharacterized protein LOC118647933 isoform X3 n=1 Tax=Monomorium pharaonis TaxID=307658 RepID=UPI0017465FEB|nr:uncharacterized protein LOC118647933 isoform X3 [Monomorium pharaonis]
MRCQGNSSARIVRWAEVRREMQRPAAAGSGEDVGLLSGVQRLLRYPVCRGLPPFPLRVFSMR